MRHYITPPINFISEVNKIKINLYGSNWCIIINFNLNILNNGLGSIKLTEKLAHVHDAIKHTHTKTKY